MNILDSLFLLNWFIVGIVWVFLMAKIGHKLHQITLPSFIVLALLIYQYLGIPFLYFSIFPDRVAENVTDKTLILWVWFYTVLAISFIILGFLLGKLVLEKGRKYGSVMVANYLVAVDSKTSFVFFTLMLASVIVSFFFYSKVGFDSIAVLAAFGISPESNIDLLRSTMTDPAVKFHRYLFFTRELFVFAWLAFFVLYLKKGHPVILVFLFIFGLFLIFNLVANTVKTSLLNFLISVVLVALIVRYRSIVRIGMVLLITSASVGLSIAMYVLFMGMETYSVALYAFFSRVFTGSLAPAYHYLTFFPEQMDWVMGGSFPNPAGLLPFDNQNITQDVYRWANPNVIYRESYSMPAAFWVEAYANFGPLSIPFVSLMMGFWIYIVHWLMVSSSHQTPATIAFYVWLMMHYHDLSKTGFSGFVIDAKLWLMLIVFMAVQFLIARGTTVKRMSLV